MMVMAFQMDGMAMLTVAIDGSPDL